MFASPTFRPSLINKHFSRIEQFWQISQCKMPYFTMISDRFFPFRRVTSTPKVKPFHLWQLSAACGEKGQPTGMVLVNGKWQFPIKYRTKASAGGHGIGSNFRFCSIGNRDCGAYLAKTISRTLIWLDVWSRNQKQLGRNFLLTAEVILWPKDLL